MTDKWRPINQRRVVRHTLKKTSLSMVASQEIFTCSNCHTRHDGPTVQVCSFIVGVKTDNKFLVYGDKLCMSGTLIAFQIYVLLIYNENYVKVCVKKYIVKISQTFFENPSSN